MDQQRKPRRRRGVTRFYRVKRGRRVKTESRVLDGISEESLSGLDAHIKQEATTQEGTESSAGASGLCEFSAVSCSVSTEEQDNSKGWSVPSSFIPLESVPAESLSAYVSDNDFQENSPADPLGDLPYNPDEKTVEETLCYVTSRLPRNWICVPKFNGLNILLYSPGEIKAVQRQVSFLFNGQIEIFVHCKPLLEAQVGTILQNITPVPLMPQNVNAFGEWVLGVVKAVRLMEVCCGVPQEEFKLMWKEEDHCYIDNNPYQELRYSETLRSKECSLLVKSFNRCPSCKKLRRNVKRRTDVHTNGCKLQTKHIYLTDNEKVEKLKAQHTEIQRLKKVIARLEKKIAASAEKNGVTVDEDPHDSDVLENANLTEL